LLVFARGGFGRGGGVLWFFVFFGVCPGLGGGCFGRGGGGLTFGGEVFFFQGFFLGGVGGCFEVGGGFFGGFFFFFGGGLGGFLFFFSPNIPLGVCVWFFFFFFWCFFVFLSRVFFFFFFVFTFFSFSKGCFFLLLFFLVEKMPFSLSTDPSLFVRVSFLSEALLRDPPPLAFFSLNNPPYCSGRIAEDSMDCPFFFPFLSRFALLHGRSSFLFFFQAFRTHEHAFFPPLSRFLLPKKFSPLGLDLSSSFTQFAGGPFFAFGLSGAKFFLFCHFRI